MYASSELASRVKTFKARVAFFPRRIGGVNTHQPNRCAVDPTRQVYTRGSESERTDAEPPGRFLSSWERNGQWLNRASTMEPLTCPVVPQQRRHITRHVTRAAVRFWLAPSVRCNVQTVTVRVTVDATTSSLCRSDRQRDPVVFTSRPVVRCEPRRTTNGRQVVRRPNSVGCRTSGRDDWGIRVPAADGHRRRTSDTRYASTDGRKAPSVENAAGASIARAAARDHEMKTVFKNCFMRY